MSLQEALLREDKVIIDTRSSEDIAERGNAVVGHINAPWTSYPYYETRFKHLSAVVPAKDTPVIVYADEQSKQTAEQFKTALEQKCGYTNVYCCVSAADMVSLNPSLEISNQANLLSTFVGQSEMRFLRESGAVLVDARDPDEIERYRDSFAGHVNIPWSTFSQYAARLKGFGGDLLGSNGLGKDSPIMVIW